MDAPAYVLATLTKAEKAGAHPAELAALRRRLMQLDEPARSSTIWLWSSSTVGSARAWV